jgi:hypothetical protein
MPALQFIIIDGVQWPVGKDTVDPSKTVMVPVEISGASGPINITAGDLNVQLSDQGPNPDVTRIGNGTNQWGINASLEGLVHDAAVLAQLLALTTAVAVVPKVASYQEIVNLTTVAQTFVAPVGAKWLKIMAIDTNSVNIRFKIGGAVATISSGMQLQAGRSEDFDLGGDISVIAESGVNQKVTVIYGV